MPASHRPGRTHPVRASSSLLITFATIYQQIIWWLNWALITLHHDTRYKWWTINNTTLFWDCELRFMLAPLLRLNSEHVISMELTTIFPSFGCKREGPHTDKRQLRIFGISSKEFPSIWESSRSVMALALNLIGAFVVWSTARENEKRKTLCFISENWN